MAIAYVGPIIGGNRLPAPSANLLEEIASLGLLPPETLAEAHGLADRFSDPSGLADELVRRGLLTAFQADRLRAGRGRELVLGQYMLLDRLGTGGMGEVYKARHRRLDRLAAVKVVRPELLAQPGAVDRFHREARAAARLRHPNAVLVHDADQAADVHFFAMEYVEGVDLARLVRERGPLPVAEACEYVRQAALGLQHAHEQGLVHRDVKPSNLIVTRDASGGPPVVKVLDFGLARFASETPEAGHLTDTGATIGTPDFLAPEQARDAHAADIRADVFGLGGTLFYLLTGQLPFPGRTKTEKLVARLSGPARPVRSLRPDLPPALGTAVDRMLALDPADRFQTPGEVAAALLPFTAAPAAEPPVQTAPPEPLAETTPHAAPPPRRRPRLWLALGAAGALAVFAMSLYLIYHSSPGATPPPAPPSPPAAAPDPIPADAREMWLVEDYEPPPELVRVLGEHEQRHWGPVLSAALSSDGKTLATCAAAPYGDKPFSVHLWDVPALTDGQGGLRERAVMGSDVGLDVLGFTHRGSLVGFQAEGGQGCEWNLGDGTSVKRSLVLSPGTAKGSSVRPVMDEHAERILIVGRDGVVRIWYTRGSKEKGFTPPERVACAAFCFHGLAVITGSDKSIRCWNVSALGHQASLDELDEQAGATAVALSADTIRAVTAYWDGRFRIWDLPHFKETAHFTGPRQASRLTLSPDGRRVFCAGWQFSEVYVLDAADGHEVSRFTGHRAPAILKQPSQPVMGLAFTATTGALTAGLDGTVRQWDPETGREPHPAAPGRGACGPLAFTDDGRLIAGGAFGPVTAWDWTSGKEAIDPAWPKESGPVMAFGPGGRSWIQYPNRFVGAAGKATDLPDEGQWTEAGAISPDGRTAALAKGGGGKPNQVILWDVEGNKERGRLQHDLIYTPMMTFTPDGKTLLVGQQEKVRLFDWAADRELGDGLPCSSLLAAVFSPAPEPDGGWLLAVSDNLQRVRLCEMHGDAVQQRLDVKSLAENATTLAFAPDGKRLAAGTPGGRVLIWDPATGKDGPSWRLPGSVTGLAFAPDGRTLAVGGGNGTVYLFRTDAPGK